MLPAENACFVKKRPVCFRVLIHIKSLNSQCSDAPEHVYSIVNAISAGTYEEWCRYRFMSILRHLAPLSSCPYMFDERPYACAKGTNYSCSGSLLASIKCNQPLLLN